MALFNDKALLWRAWPDGYLAVRGVQTLGGDTLAGGEEKGLPAVAGDDAVRDWGWRCLVLEEQKKAGKLFPRVDSSDVATWACLLHDLARAAKWSPSSPQLFLDRPANYGELWLLADADGGFYRLPVVYGDPEWWADLSPAVQEHYRQHAQGGVATLELEEALVRARIHVREEEGR